MIAMTNSHCLPLRANTGQYYTFTKLWAFSAKLKHGLVSASIFGATVSGLFLQLHPICYKDNRKSINICAVTVDNNLYNFNS